jgi:hypothetical protein
MPSKKIYPKYKLWIDWPGYRVGNGGSIWTQRCRVGWHKMSPSKDRDGYLQVKLRRNGKPYCRRVNTLVCTAFHGPKPFRGAQALHRNDVRTDNRPGNLYWGTHGQNMKDRARNGKTYRGDRNPNARLNLPKVRQIRSRAASGERPVDLAREFGVGDTCIYSILKGSSWKEAA